MAEPMEDGKKERKFIGEFKRYKNNFSFFFSFPGKQKKAAGCPLAIANWSMERRYRSAGFDPWTFETNSM